MTAFMKKTTGGSEERQRTAVPRTDSSFYVPPTSISERYLISWAQVNKVIYYGLSRWGIQYAKYYGLLSSRCPEIDKQLHSPSVSSGRLTKQLCPQCMSASFLSTQIQIIRWCGLHVDNQPDRSPKPNNHRSLPKL